MKIGNKGFISISIIYSFFIVFLLLLLLVITTYTSNRTNFGVFINDIKKKHAQTGISLSNYLLSLNGLDSGEGKIVEENALRYEGKNPNNYLNFDGALWRVIGVFETEYDSDNDGIVDTAGNLVKIIKDESATTYTYENAKNAFVSTYLSNLMVATVKWSAGGVNNTNLNAESIYANQNTSTITSKVGFMSLSDYAYATLSSSCARSTHLSEYNFTCLSENWLAKGIDEWMLTPNSSGGQFKLNSDKTTSSVDTTSLLGARPVVYLEEDVLVISGNGSLASPYSIRR